MSDDFDLRISGLEDAAEIGRGGFATVYSAHQPAFRRTVAVKLLAAGELDEVARSRFERECQAMGSLSDHPGIVTVHDAGFTDDGRPYLVMAHMIDGSLSDKLAGFVPLPWPEGVALGVKLAGALETAHRADVLHRDIKPANVLISPYGEPQLTDFGIARIAGGHETKSGVVTASLPYAPPEVLEGHRPAPAGDLYSLGACIYDALAGSAAFLEATDESLTAMLKRILADRPPDLREHGVPSAVADVVEKAMAKSPTDRQQSALELGRELQAAEAATGVAVTPLTVTGEPRLLLITPQPTDDAATVVIPPPPPAAAAPPSPPTAAPPPPPPAAAAPPPPAAVVAAPTLLAATPPPPELGHHPPAAGDKQGPKVGLIVGILIAVVLIIGGVAFALTRGDDNPTEPDESLESDEPLEPDEPDESDEPLEPDEPLDLDTDGDPVTGSSSQLLLGDVGSGTITEPGGVDVYEYDGVGGEAIALYMYSDDGDAYVTLYDTDGNFLAQDDDSAGGHDAVVFATLPNSGVYFLEASIFGDGVGSYDLFVDPAPPELIPGLGAFGQLDTGDFSTYWFQGFFDQDVVIEMYSDVGDSYVQLSDNLGTFLVNDDDTLEISGDAHLRAKLPADGPFFVDASFLSGSGSFELQLYEQPTNEVFFEETAHGLIDPFGIHEYTYYGLVGEGLSVVMNTDFIGGVVELYSPSGAFIASGPPGNPSIALPLAEEGFYTLSVTSTDGTGTYSIFLSGAG